MFIKKIIKRAGMPSGPVALCEFKPINILCTCSVLTGVKEKSPISMLTLSW